MPTCKGQGSGPKRKTSRAGGNSISPSVTSIAQPSASTTGQLGPGACHSQSGVRTTKRINSAVVPSGKNQAA